MMMRIVDMAFLAVLMDVHRKLRVPAPSLDGYEAPFTIQTWKQRTCNMLDQDRFDVGLAPARLGDRRLKGASCQGPLPRSINLLPSASVLREDRPATVAPFAVASTPPNRLMPSHSRRHRAPSGPRGRCGIPATPE
jgi:hypothetical protein